MFWENVPPFKHVLAGQAVGIGIGDGDGDGDGDEGFGHRLHKNGQAFLIGLVELHDSRVNKLHLGSSCWHVKSAHNVPV